MTEVTGRLQWRGMKLYFGNLCVGEVVQDKRQRYMEWSCDHTFSFHYHEQAARDALFARVKAAITEETP